MNTSVAQHRAMRQNLTAGHEAKVAELRQHQLGRRMMEVSFFVGLWAMGTGMIVLSVLDGETYHWSLRIVGTIMAALGLNGMILLLHEGMHGVLFPNRVANRVVSVLLGGCTWIGYSAYKVMHNRHHEFLGDPRDLDDYNHLTDKPVRLLLLHCTRLIAGSLLYIFLIPILAWRYGNRVDRRNVAIEYTLLFAVYAVICWWVPTTIILCAWVIPVVIVGWMVNVRGFTQHSICDATDPYVASRNVHPHPVVAFLMLHENLHFEHHLYPDVPSYHLPALHRLIRDRLPRTNSVSSYLGFVGRFVRQTLAGHRSPIGCSGSPVEKSPETINTHEA